MRILVADDDAVSRNLTAQMLQHHGHEVDVVEDGRAALQALDEDEVQVLISDWMMPGMDGIELCKTLREQHLGRYVFIILMTSNNRSQDLVTALSAGADEFIQKPFAPAELLVRLRTAERVLALETREVAIFAMAKLAESRDPETGAHLERVRGYCRILAAHMMGAPKFAGVIDRPFIRLLYETSPLHDIGKVGIPDSVLLKPGRLSDAEFEAMKQHTLIGAETLDAAARAYPEARFFQMAHDIALGHHERYDGTGYPNAIAGEDIPLAARIVSVADVFDALTTRRVYKPAFDFLVAKNIIVEGAATQFDPDVVEAFVAKENEIHQIKLKLDEQEQANQAAA